LQVWQRPAAKSLVGCNTCRQGEDWDKQHDSQGDVYCIMEAGR
jgi:hypothetical protein